MRLLASPKTWCDGARQLVQLKDPRAIPPLLAAYDRPTGDPTLEAHAAQKKSPALRAKIDAALKARPTPR